MKKINKLIFLGIIVIIFVFCISYDHIKQNNYYANEGEIYFNSIENMIIEETNKIVLHITGEVKSPGIIEISEGDRLVDAIEAAGGFTEFADVNKINLAYIVQDGQKINIPKVNTVETGDYITEEIGENVIKEDVKLKTSLVNINTAIQAELENLTGIGPSTALKIINYREKIGKFKTIEEIKDVPGIGEAKFEIIKNEICV